MKLSKLVSTFRNIMTQKSQKTGDAKPLDSLTVQLNPVKDQTSRSFERKKSVQHIISMMVADLHRRGRPCKNEEGELSHAA